MRLQLYQQPLTLCVNRDNIQVNMKTILKIIRNRYVFVAAFASIIAISQFFVIPLPRGIPIVLKNLFVILAGAVLGSYYGGLANLIVIAAGLLGAPVFVIPGPATFATPLGGYIIGYFLGSLATGFICGLPKISEKKIQFPAVLKISLASLLGFAIILLCGVFYMMRLNSMTLSAAFAAGFVPFVFGDFIKLLICIPLAVKLRPIAARYVNI